ncbi:MAG: helix-turn-helix domain-containing protein [Oscillospiraceae bacterium]
MNQEILPYGTRNLIGRRVAQARREHNMKQVQLLAKLQLSGLEFTEPVLSKLERQRRQVSDRELKILSDILDVSADWLIGREPGYSYEEHRTAGQPTAVNSSC